MVGFGIEQTGQQYSLFVEQGVQDAAFAQRQHSYDEISAAERRMQGGVTGSELTIEIARHEYHRQRVHKLTRYCLASGLLDQDVLV